MKTKLIFSTHSKDTEQWTNLPFVPRINEWFNIVDILSKEEIALIKQSAQSWSGVKGIISSIEYRHDENEFYPEVIILCEDSSF